jgi:hypothetical protein
MGGKPEGEEIKSLHDKTNGCARNRKRRNYAIYAEITQKLRRNYAEITQKLRRNYAKITQIRQKLRRNYAEITQIMQK